MRDVAIHEVEAGAVLAEPVLDSQGRILLQRGSVLTHVVIRRLSRWQVTSVTIREESGKKAKPAAMVEHEPAAEEVVTVAAPSPAVDPRVVWDQLFSDAPERSESQCIRGALVRWYDQQVTAAREATE